MALLTGVVPYPSSPCRTCPLQVPRASSLRVTHPFQLALGALMLRARDKYQEPFITVAEALQAAFEVLGRLSADLPE